MKLFVFLDNTTCVCQARYFSAPTRKKLIEMALFVTKGQFTEVELDDMSVELEPDEYDGLPMTIIGYSDSFVYMNDRTVVGDLKSMIMHQYKTRKQKIKTFI